MVTDIESKVTAYTQACEHYGTPPTVTGLADSLGVSERTLYRVIHHEYAKGKPYTSRPHPKREIDNGDFALLESVFTGWKD
jgi:predicted DNA-binding transcriptional regulator YafY